MHSIENLPLYTVTVIVATGEELMRENSPRVYGKTPHGTRHFRRSESFAIEMQNSLFAKYGNADTPCAIVLECKNPVGFPFLKFKRRVLTTCARYRAAYPNLKPRG
jgi:hypothetical protein